MPIQLADQLAVEVDDQHQWDEVAQDECGHCEPVEDELWHHVSTLVDPNIGYVLQSGVVWVPLAHLVDENLVGRGVGEHRKEKKQGEGPQR